MRSLTIWFLLSIEKATITTTAAIIVERGLGFLDALLEFAELAFEKALGRLVAVTAALVAILDVSLDMGIGNFGGEYGVASC